MKNPILQSRKGSVLVGTVAFAALMSISGAAFIRMVGSTINNENMALTDTRAFHAAESGLWMGTRWLRDTANFADMESYADGTYSLFNPIIGGINIEVQVVKNGSDYRVESTADIDGVVGYDKTVSWVLRESMAGRYGTFIHNFGSTNTQGLKSVTFYGPFHCNSSIWFAEGSGKGIFVNFTGPVSIHNRNTTGMSSRFDYTPKFDYSSGDWGDFGVSSATGNDYNFGLADKNGSIAEFDSRFAGVYRHSAPEYEVKFDPTSATVVNISTGNSGDDLHSPQDRPTILFNVNSTTGVGEYLYFPRGATSPSQTGTLSGPTILHPSTQHVNVLGTVKGQVTVWTDQSYSIYPVGDLLYHGATTFNATAQNWGIPIGNSNICGLYSGKNIAFGKYSFDPTSGAKTNMTGQTVSAQVFALESGCSHVWEKKNKKDIFDLAHYDSHYDLRVIGSRAVDTYLYHKEQGKKSARHINFHYDERLTRIQAPGISGYCTVPSSGPILISFATRDWTLQNTIP